MRLHTSAILVLFALAFNANAQSNQYKRTTPKTAPAQAAPAATPTAAKDGKSAAAPEVKKDEKLDITDLEQKYWAPKDTDFSVVQNRTYTKAGRVAASFMTGPIVNDPFSSGYNPSFKANYYFSERYGVEFQYIDYGNLEDSKTIDHFKSLSGGGTMPDFNRPMNYMGLGFNWVPFYAKMSFLGSKILYFDMQFTPHVGMSQYEQIVDSGEKSDEPTEFSYGVDVTQFIFFTKHLAFRADLHNRYYTHEIRAFDDGAKQGSKTENVTTFLIGVTLFY